MTFLTTSISKGSLLSRATWNIASPLIIAAGFFAVWEAVARIFAIPEVLLPAPTRIADAFIRAFPTLVEQAIPTTREVIGGFLLAVVIGVGLAALMVQSARLKAALYPNLVALQLVPKIALAPLFVVWLGIGSSSRLTFALFISVFPIIISTATGLMSVERDILRFCQSLTATRTQVLFLVRFPYSLPHVFAGLKIAITMALLGVITGEFITAQEGLGYLIIFATSRSETALMMAAVAMLCIIGIALYGMLEIAEKFVARLFPID